MAGECSCGAAHGNPFWGCPACWDTKAKALTPTQTEALMEQVGRGAPWDARLFPRKVSLDISQ